MNRDNFLIQQHGLHRVDFLDTEPQQQEATPSTRNAWACVIGSALGLAGLAYVTAYVLGRLQLI